MKLIRKITSVMVSGVNLNIELVRNGLARVVLYEKRAKGSFVTLSGTITALCGAYKVVRPKIKYQDELLSVEIEAREKRLGVWKK